jgi:5-methylcytosine-specific restriction enzyme A
MTEERRWRLPEERKPLTRKQYRELFLAQDGRCKHCNQRLEVKGAQEVEVAAQSIDEHLVPLWLGGSNDIATNRELWCLPCTKPKTAGEATARAKSDRVRDKYIGAKKQKGSMPFGRHSNLRRKMDGSVVDRRTGEIIR